MVADWTNYNAEIAAFWRAIGRSGIPLYLMYPADPAAQPLILPQLLSKNMVLEALKCDFVEEPRIARRFDDNTPVLPAL